MKQTQDKRRLLQNVKILAHSALWYSLFRLIFLMNGSGKVAKLKSQSIMLSVNIRIDSILECNFAISAFCQSVNPCYGLFYVTL